MEWLKLQKSEYLENGTEFFYEIKKFLKCVKDNRFWQPLGDKIFNSWAIRVFGYLGH